MASTLPHRFHFSPGTDDSKSRKHSSLRYEVQQILHNSVHQKRYEVWLYSMPGFADQPDERACLAGRWRPMVILLAVGDICLELLIFGDFHATC